MSLSTPTPPSVLHSRHLKRPIYEPKVAYAYSGVCPRGPKPWDTQEKEVYLGSKIAAKAVDC